MIDEQDKINIEFVNEWIEKAKKDPKKGIGGTKIKGLVGWVGRVGFNECVAKLTGKRGITDAKAVCGALKHQARKTGKLAKKHMGRLERKRARTKK